jgi:hypothetical protein
MLLTLVIVPVVYTLIDDLGRLRVLGWVAKLRRQPRGAGAQHAVPLRAEDTVHGHREG